MRTTLRPTPAPAALLAGLLLMLACAAGAADPPAPGQIYQQRAADGRIVLTDRPSPTAVTERTWQVERDDPAAAQRRASDVRREADAVSERVQRRIDAQERYAAENDLERMRLAQREREFQLLLARAESDNNNVVVLVAPALRRTPMRHRASGFEPPRRTPHAAERVAWLRG